MADPMDILKLGQQNFQAVLSMQESNMAKTIGLMQTGNELELKAVSSLFQAAEGQRFHDAQIEGMKTENAIRSVQAKAQLEATRLAARLQPLKIKVEEAKLKEAENAWVTGLMNESIAPVDRQFSATFSGNYDTEFASKYEALKMEHMQKARKDPANAQKYSEELQQKANALISDYSYTDPEAGKRYSAEAATVLRTYGSEKQQALFERYNPQLAMSATAMRQAITHPNQEIAFKNMQLYDAFLTDPERLHAGIINSAQEGSAATIRSNDKMIHDLTASTDKQRTTLAGMIGNEPTFERMNQEYNDALADLTLYKTQNRIETNKLKAMKKSFEETGIIAEESSQATSPKPLTQSQIRFNAAEDARKAAAAETKAPADQFKLAVLGKQDPGYSAVATEINNMFNLGATMVQEDEFAQTEQLVPRSLLQNWNSDYIDRTVKANIDTPEMGDNYIAQHFQQKAMDTMKDPQAREQLIAQIGNMNRELATLSQPVTVLIDPDKDPREPVTPDKTYERKRAQTSMDIPGATGYHQYKVPTVDNVMTIKPGDTVAKLMKAAAEGGDERDQDIVMSRVIAAVAMAKVKQAQKAQTK